MDCDVIFNNAIFKLFKNDQDSEFLSFWMIFRNLFLDKIVLAYDDRWGTFPPAYMALEINKISDTEL